ncbi:MAG: TonB-dependent receptor [Candidatus Symbiothrix sp.]|jgi:TonB-linked SusC/RagA family outer membrane protein|nr:TonB-dependent receptor [Candidatus Symbiothrix sp.]
MKELLLGLLMFSIGFYASAQTTISGKVTSSADELEMPGVSVVEKGTSVGTVTDINGEFSIKISSEKAVLVFMYIGYKTKEVAVTGTAKNLQVVLDEDNQLLDEVVVVGYGTMKKRDLTGSISSISGERLKESVVTSFDQALQGRLAGVQVTQNSGAPGGTTSIRIRGASSINNSNEPLYIIDGVTYSGDGNSTIGFDWAGGTNGQNRSNPLSFISPADIVSIDVLKDASATAIYGANGANGVIIVTTKRGEAGQTSINYEGGITIQNLAKKIQMMDLKDYAQYQLEIGSFLQLNPDVHFGDPSILGKGTDWQDEIFRTALMQNHQVSMTGGTDKIKYAASGGYTDQEGIMIGSDFNRFNGRVNIDAQLNKWISSGASLAFSHTKETITNNDGGDGVILQSLTMQPNIPVYNFDGTWAGPNSVYGASQWNPVWLALMKNNAGKRNNSTGNFYLQIEPIKGLTLKSEYGFNYANARAISFIPRYSFGLIGSSLNQMHQQDDESNYWVWKNLATYTQSFGQHNLQVMFGTETAESAWEGNWLRKQNLATDDVFVMTNDGEFKDNNGWKDGSTQVSYFGRAFYNYADKYLATATFRRDASSKFGANYKWGSFPSASLAWRASGEDFLIDNESISNLKLRLGWGRVGKTPDDPHRYATWMSSMQTVWGTGYYMGNIGNTNLRWEASEQYNLGIDLGLWHERLSIALDFYHKNTKDLLLQLSVPPYLIGLEPPMTNIGKSQNRGLDLTINTVNIQKKNFEWTSNLVFSLNRNKVMALNDDDQIIPGKIDWFAEFQSATHIQVGQPLGVYYGYVVDRLFTSEQDILESPVQIVNEATLTNDPNNPGVNLFNQKQGVYVGDIKFKDISGPNGIPDGIINDYDQTIIGDPNPDFTFGFTNTFRYKNFDLGLTLTGVYGSDVLNWSRSRIEGMSSIWDNQAKSVVDRAQVGTDANGNAYLLNPSTTIPRPSDTDFNRNNRMSDRFIEDGSYLRIQNLSLGYTVPVSLTKKIGIQSLKVLVNVQNLYTFTKYSGYDPEIGAYNQGVLLQNIDRGHYPSPRSFTFGLNVGF